MFITTDKSQYVIKLTDYMEHYDLNREGYDRQNLWYFLVEKITSNMKAWTVDIKVDRYWSSSKLTFYNER